MTHPFAAEGYVRLPQIIGPFGPLPISKSTLWARVKSGTFPSPVKLGPHTTAWRVEDIKAFLENPEEWSDGAAQ